MVGRVWLKIPMILSSNWVFCGFDLIDMSEMYIWEYLIYGKLCSINFDMNISLILNTQYFEYKKQFIQALNNIGYLVVVLH